MRVGMHRQAVDSAGVQAMLSNDTVAALCCLEGQDSSAVFLALHDAQVVLQDIDAAKCR